MPHVRNTLAVSAAALLLSACGTADSDVAPSPSPNVNPSLSDPTSEAALESAQPAADFSADPELIDQGAWWSWAGSEPFGQGPVEDSTGASCDVNQPADLWFLAGTFGGHEDRTCEIPSGVPIVFPIVNMAGGPEDCDGFLAGAEGTASLDDVAIEVHELAASAGEIVAVDDNAVFGDGGTFEVTMCGLWAVLEPLTAGEHLVEFEGESDGFAVSASYSLTVT